LWDAEELNLSFLQNAFTEHLHHQVLIHPFLFVPRDGYAPPPIACKTITLLLRQRGL